MHRRLLPILFLSGLAFGPWLPGCGRDPLLTEHPAYAAYKKHCRRCHGDAGDGRRATRMAERPIDLGSSAYRDTVDAARVDRVIREGLGRMKGYEGKVTEAELEALLDYVLRMAEARRTERAP